MTNKNPDLSPTHPLAFELSSLRLAVSRFQDEAYTTSVKLQRYSLESSNARDRATYLERENEVLRTELAILRTTPHPDASLQSHPAVAQAQQLTLSLRKLSDKLSLTEAALLERTTQLSHATAEVSKAKLTAEAAYELAARTRGREEAGKSRELELEHKIKAAEEGAKMSDLVVKEYADLVRSLQADKSHERLLDGLAEGKLGLQRLLNEFNAETAKLQKELFEAQGALAVADSQRDSEKRHLARCRDELAESQFELAESQFELQKLKIDDNTAAKMVSRYMKFSQKSTDTLSEALSSLKTRHSATTSTLSFQLLSLRSQLHASSVQTETLRRALDEVGGELAKEASGRRREVALRIRMVNREEKIRGEMERWVVKAEKAQERAQAKGRMGDGDFGMIVSAARAVLEGVFGGEDAEVGRVALAETAVRELQMELEKELGRRLELEMNLALKKAQEAMAASSGAVDDEHSGEVLEKSEKRPIVIPYSQDTTADPTPVTVGAPSPETPPLLAEVEFSQRLLPDDSTPITSIATTSGTRESPLGRPPTTLMIYAGTLNNNDEQPPPSSTNSQLRPMSTPDSAEVNFADIPVKDNISTLTSEKSLRIAEAASVQKQAPEDSVPIMEATIVNCTRESPLNSVPPTPSISNEIPSDKEEKVSTSMPADLINGISTDEIDVTALSVEGPNDLEALTPTPVEPEISLNGDAYHNGLVLTDKKTTLEEDPSTVEYATMPKNTITKLFHGADSILPGDKQLVGQLDSTAIMISSNKPTSTDYDSTLETEYESPSVLTLLHDGSSGPTSRASDTLFVSHSLISSTISPSGPPTISLDILSPPHPLLADLAKAKHRYDTLQCSLRDCHLALESLAASLESTTTGRVPAEALRTAAQRLNDYTEDARVELEIRIADEEIVGRGFEMMLCMPGALAMPTTHALLSSEKGQGEDTMTHSDVEKRVEAFVNGTNPSVSKAVQSLTRKLEDIQHDIAALKRAVHDANGDDANDTDATSASYPASSITSTNINKAGGGGWTSWIPSIPTSSNPSSSPSPSRPPFSMSAPGLGPSPTFGSVISSPGLRHSPSLDLLEGKKGIDPFTVLGLRVPMPSYVQDQALAVVQPRSRTLSTMYMLGLGARSVSGSGNGSGSKIFGSPKKGRTVPEMRDESEEDSDVE